MSQAEAMTTSSDHCSTKVEDPADPDIAGVGIISAFITTAVLSQITCWLAVFLRGIPAEQYRYVDERALALFRIKRPSPEDGHVTRYQTFLLALSDQILITGIALLITTFAQIRSLSAFSFHVVVPLASCASSIHLDTLLVLRSHFIHHRRQTAARVFFMLLFLLMVLAAQFLELLIWDHSGDSTAVCEISKRDGDPVDTVVYEWLANALLLISLYYWAICALLGSNDAYGQIMSTSTVALLRLAYGREDLESYLREQRPGMIQRSREDHNVVSKPSPNGRPTRQVRVIVFRLLLQDIFSSLIFSVLLSGLWLGLQLMHLFNYLVERSDVDTQPLFEVSFGQMMPLLMLAAFIMNALEVGEIRTANKDRVDNCAMNAPSDQPESSGSTSHDAGASSTHSSGMQSTTRTPSHTSQQHRRNTTRSSSTTAAIADEEPVSEVPRGQNMLLQDLTALGRVNTLTLAMAEDGISRDKDTGFDGLDILRAAHRYHKRAVIEGVAAGILFLGAMIAMLVFSFEIMIYTMAGILLLLRMLELLQGAAGVALLRSRRRPLQIGTATTAQASPNTETPTGTGGEEQT